MYCTYEFSPSSNSEQILADIVLLATGETNKANLSASCDTGANTNIFTAYDAAGWTVWDTFVDAAVGNHTAYVLRAPCIGDATQFKYVYLTLFYWAPGSAYRLYSVPYESWNASTHIGTNGAPIYSTSVSYSPLLMTGTGGNLRMSISPRRMLFQCTTTDVSNPSHYGKFGPSGLSTFCGLAEIDRGNPGEWTNVGSTYSNFGWLFSSTNGQVGLRLEIVRALSFSNTIISSPNIVYLNMPITSIAGHNSNSPAITAYPIKQKDGSSRTLVLPILAGAFDTGNVTSLPGLTNADVWFAYVQTGVAVEFDEVPFNGKTYIIAPNTPSTVQAYPALIVPKG